MRLYYVKEAPGQHAAVQFDENGGPYKLVALFRTERDARRFVDAADRSMTTEEEQAARKKRNVN